MKSEYFSAHSKYMILRHGLRENNIAHTCKLFGISRTTFYNWYKSYQKNGMSGLKNKESKKPEMPNKVSKSMENEILAYVAKFPNDGPKRIHYELKSEGIEIGESGIYNVLKRNNLSKRAERVAFSKDKTINMGVKQRKKQIDSKVDFSQKATSPCQFVIQRIDYIGRFDGIGRIYQYSLYDVFSNLAVAKLYNRKQDIDVWYFFDLKIVYLLKTFNLKIDCLITKKTKEFLPYFVKENKFNQILDHLNINHCFFEEGEQNSLLDSADNFNEFLVKEFYNKIGRDKSVDSFIKLERAFLKFLRHHNFSRTITTGPNSGKVPAEVLLEKAVENKVDVNTLPLWILALLNQPKGVDFDD